MNQWRLCKWLKTVNQIKACSLTVKICKTLSKEIDVDYSSINVYKMKNFYNWSNQNQCDLILKRQILTCMYLNNRKLVILLNALCFVFSYNTLNVLDRERWWYHCKKCK